MGAGSSAITRADRIRASSTSFRARVDRALDTIRQASEIGRVGVSFSGGKDSTVLLDLVRRVIPNAPAAWFDPGVEMRSTRALVEHYGVETVKPRISYPEMARYSGWWGYPEAVDPGCPFRVKLVLIEEPSEAFVVRKGLRAICVGLRADESKGRMLNAKVRGELYEGRDRTWYCTPLAFWSTADVWAYLADRGLRYHPAYDVLTGLGIDREQQRIGMLLDANPAAWGSLTQLRWIEPDTWAELAREFPGVARVS